MRIVLMLVIFLGLSGCTSMLLGGSGTYRPPADQCEQQNGEERKRDC